MTAKQPRRGSPRPGNGGKRSSAGRPIQRWTLSKAAAGELHSLIRQQQRPGLAILEDLIGAAYADQAVKEKFMSCSCGALLESPTDGLCAQCAWNHEYALLVRNQKAFAGPTSKVAEHANAREEMAGGMTTLEAESEIGK